MTSFTYDHYRHLLAEFKNRGYDFAEFGAARKLLDQGQPFVLLRHDIDMDLGKALEMARIEAEAGATATYFFLLRTDFYNLFSQSASECIRQILALGHQLGLHFDCAAYRGADGGQCSTAEIAAHVHREARLLGDWFGELVDVVSFHRPNSAVLTGNPALSQPLWHTYMKCFTEQMFYVADSRGSFRYGHPLDSEAFAEGQPMQLLTHPIWWSAAGRSPSEELRRLLGRQELRLRQTLAENCVVPVGESLEHAA